MSDNKWLERIFLPVNGYFLIRCSISSVKADVEYQYLLLVPCLVCVYHGSRRSIYQHYFDGKQIHALRFVRLLITRRVYLPLTIELKDEYSRICQNILVITIAHRTKQEVITTKVTHGSSISPLIQDYSPLKLQRTSTLTHIRTQEQFIRMYCTDMCRNILIRIAYDWHHQPTYQSNRNYSDCRRAK